MHALERIRRSIYRVEDLLFDTRANIHTRGYISSSNLQTRSSFREHATAYTAVWCRNVRELILTSRKLGYELHSFVDVGCGKGKACFYASRFGFSNIIGIDFDSRLIAAANANKATFRYRTDGIEFSLADAVDYLIPREPAVVFMFNPFDAYVMKRFLDNNRERFRESNSLLAYANDSQTAVLSEVGMEPLFREARRKISLWRFP